VPVLLGRTLFEAQRAHVAALPLRSRSFWPSGRSSPFGPTCR
jgi:hypothetical protein